MNDEAVALAKTLAWAGGMVLQSDPEDRHLIALAYWEAKTLVASIPKDNGDARPRIVTCFARSDAYRAVEDIACVGWILTAIQERVNERDLPDWRKLRKVVDQTVKLLPQHDPTVH